MSDPFFPSDGEDEQLYNSRDTFTDDETSDDENDAGSLDPSDDDDDENRVTALMDDEDATMQSADVLHSESRLRDHKHPTLSALTTAHAQDANRGSPASALTSEPPSAQSQVSLRTPDGKEILSVRTEPAYGDPRSPPSSSQQSSAETSPRRMTSRYQFTEHIQDTTTPLHNVVPKFKLKSLPAVAFGEKNITSEDLETCQLLHEAVQMRRKVVKLKYPWESSYDIESGEEEPETPKVVASNPFKKRFSETPSPTTDESFYLRKGVMVCSKFKPAVSYAEHYSDFKKLKNMIWHAPTKSFCHTRLKLLDFKFSLYKALHAKNELSEQKNVQHRDFYNVRKVDNHVHLSSSMNQKHLLKFIKSKLRTSGEERVLVVDGKELTLNEVFKSLNLTAYDLNVDSLEVHAGGKVVVHRFDKFNAKYNPFGQSELREIFLKTDNHVKGKYFSEVCKQVFQELDESKYIMSEPRVSVYGRDREEWSNLADWVVDHDMFSNNVRWMIQIPRLYHLHKKRGCIRTFQDMLDNIFTPLFEVTKDPSSNPKLHEFLNLVVAFDHVDDESKAEGRFHSRLPMPDVWCTKDNPPYNYYNYFFWANLSVLNQYRKSKGMNTIAFRPHAGEAGDISHLISSYLLADGIAHGIEVRRTPVLEYLYYLSQIGMSLSPLSNNHLFLKYSRNPFPRFFARGLNVTLSTDDPLMFHFTREPLMEEYSIAAQVWHFSAADKCEIARNSVLQSGFPSSYKQYWVSPYYDDCGPRANQIEKTNVPSLRMQYRYETLLEEHLFIQKALHILDRSENTFLKIRPSLNLEEVHTLIEDLKKDSRLDSLRMNSMILRPSEANRVVPNRVSTICAGTSTEDLHSVRTQHSDSADDEVDTRSESSGSLFSLSSQTKQVLLMGSVPFVLAAVGAAVGMVFASRFGSKGKNGRSA
mmetsp:Transcript_10572/g.39371  ORF Transcript_10572/g.39371 Transcript_10572/m.39371 type:complete len:924 (-) Transcript_10572:840-3611(-)|eukprot:CAMPEP_0117443706 /NCGR_PEP_ID=MMETSP0759-20121206/4840_1 /TAXON_ID=63605 /ORGANISM="Percolomonas cosmopolitus, Strain WS" /LENGTH=923 /DNA_ID=CAMNT_0005235703 /DNA_START=188 /DNA_END=2959 /DNA_ORIENTATION=-